MPKGVYTRKRKVPEPEPSEPAAESGLEEEEASDEEGSAPRKRRKKRKALFTREKPARRQKAMERAAERAQRLKKAKDQDNRGSEDRESQEKDETKPSPKTEELVFPQPTAATLATFSPLQLLLDHLLRAFHRKDPEEYFVFPVTDDEAPGYSEVVQEQMNLMAMRQKLDANGYPSLDAFKTDIHLILKNCKAYNQPNTVYYAAAKKLESMSNTYFSKNYLSALAQQYFFVREISEEELGLRLPQPFTSSPTTGPKPSSVVVDDMDAEEVLASAQAAAASARRKLATFRPKAKLAFLNRKDDGATQLSIIIPEKVSEPGTSDRPITLGDLVPRPKEGNPGLSPWSEQSEKLLAPVTFLNYGPYASFAPTYDSTWATLDKDTSAKLLSTYGEPDAVEYAWSLRNFVYESGDYVLGMVDSLLDTLTGGEHSRLHGSSTAQLAKAEAAAGVVDWDGLKSLSSLGVDVSWLDKSEKTETTPLTETGQLLEALAGAQNARLSANPGLTLTNVKQAGEAEVELASAVVERLGAAVSSTGPGDLVGEKELRQCLGITDDIDMDVFNEFLVPE